MTESCVGKIMTAVITAGRQSCCPFTFLKPIKTIPRTAAVSQTSRSNVRLFRAPQTTDHLRAHSPSFHPASKATIGARRLRRPSKSCAVPREPVLRQIIPVNHLLPVCAREWVVLPQNLDLRTSHHIWRKSRWHTQSVTIAVPKGAQITMSKAIASASRCKALPNRSVLRFLARLIASTLKRPCRATNGSAIPMATTNPMATPNPMPRSPINRKPQNPPTNTPRTAAPNVAFSIAPIAFTAGMISNVYSPILDHPDATLPKRASRQIQGEEEHQLRRRPHYLGVTQVNGNQDEARAEGDGATTPKCPINEPTTPAYQATTNNFMRCGNFIAMPTARMTPATNAIRACRGLFIHLQPT